MSNVDWMRITPFDTDAAIVACHRSPTTLSHCCCGDDKKNVYVRPYSNPKLLKIIDLKKTHIGTSVKLNKDFENVCILG